MRKTPPPLPSAPQRELDYASELNDVFDFLDTSIRRDKLHCALQLATEAARGEGILVDHFIELGRRFGSSTAQKTKRAHDRLRLIKGGKD